MGRSTDDSSVLCIVAESYISELTFIRCSVLPSHKESLPFLLSSSPDTIPVCYRMKSCAHRRAPYKLD